MAKKLLFAKSPVREMMKNAGAQLVAKGAVDLLIDHIQQAATQLTRMSLMYAMHAKRKKITRDDVLISIKNTPIRHKFKAKKYIITQIKVLPDDVMSDADINWVSINDMSDAGINWLDIDVMSDAGINWADIDIMGDRGINWEDLSVMSTRGVNWTSVNDMSDAGITGEIWR